MSKKLSIVSLIVITMLMLMIGCTKKDVSEQNIALQNRLISALEQQKEVSNYQFAGQANLTLDWSVFSGQLQDPLTAGLTSILTSGLINWHGVSDLATGRMEADVQLHPHALQTTFDIPILINNNKLLLQIPLLAADEDEYLSYDLPNRITPLPLHAFASEFISSLDSEYFITLEGDDQDFTSIGIQVTQDNIHDIRQTLLSSLPDLISELSNDQWFSDQQVTHWHDELASLEERFNITTVDQPGLVSFTINEDGFIIKEQIALYFDNQTIEIEQHYTDVNDSASAFRKSMPEHVRPLEQMIEQFR